MGIKIHGECGGCRHESDLVIDGRFCSEKCKRRYHDNMAWSTGFSFGVMSTAFIAGVLFISYVWFHREKPDPIAKYEQEQQVLAVLKAFADSASIQLSNDLQRAIQTRELERKEHQDGR